MAIWTEMDDHLACSALAAGATDIKVNNYHGFPAYLSKSFAGLVVSTFEKNWYDDSDFFAVVWDADLGRPVDVCYATTRFASLGSAKVDAPADVMAAYKAYLAAEAAKVAAERAARMAATPAKGKTLKVVKGRKVPKGTVGTCIWVGNSKFGTRVGIKDASGDVHWTAATNVEVVL